MKIIIANVAILICFALSYSTGIDSVTVDSVWNSDSSWYNGNGILQQRLARDCRISFIPQGSGLVMCSLSVSLDSGKTWGASPNPLCILDSMYLDKPILCGQKEYAIVRVFGADRPGVAFKIIGDNCINTITSPIARQKLVAGDTLLVTWTQSVQDAKLSYNFNRGGGWVEFASVTKVDDNSVKTVLPITSYTDSFQIKVEDNGGTFDAGTSGLLSIKYIVISSPTAGSTLTQGSTTAIRFKACTAKISSLRIMLSTDGGKSYGDMLNMSIDPSLTSLDWIVGAEPGAGAPFAYPSSTCILKIRDYNNDQLRDFSGIFGVQ